MQREGEFTRLLALYRDERPTRVLELGVGYGGSLFYWLRDARRDAHVTVVAVDSFHEYDNRPLFDDWVPDNVELHVIDGRTSELNTVARVYAIVPDEFDWVFIDADHSYGSALLDWKLYGQHAHTVVFHDIRSDPRIHPEIEVGRLFDELCERYEWLELADQPAPEGWGGLGVIWPGRSWASSR